MSSHSAHQQNFPPFPHPLLTPTFAHSPPAIAPSAQIVAGKGTFLTQTCLNTVCTGFVGSGVGIADGCGVGGEVGAAVIGCPVGSGVGLADGCGVGGEVGAAVIGCPVGSGVGLADGCGVGGEVGAAVIGCPVGSGVGLADGCGVGGEVGAAVIGCPVGSRVGDVVDAVLVTHSPSAQTP
jgi:hypothetical protein